LEEIFMGLFGDEKNEFDYRFEFKGRGSIDTTIKYEIIADKVTGVHYLVTVRYGNSGSGFGVTPLLDENGKVFIQKPGPEQE